MRTSSYTIGLAIVAGLFTLQGCTKQLNTAQTAARRVSTSIFGTSEQESRDDWTAVAPQDSTRQTTIVRAIDLVLEVNKCDDMIDLVGREAHDLGGNILETKVESPEDSEKTAVIRLRVPVQSVDSLLLHARRAARRVDVEGVRASDARGELEEFDSRMAVKVKAEAEYVTMLSSARTTADRLEILRALLDTRETIAGLRRSRAALLDQIVFPEVKIQLRERDPLDDPARPGFWKKVRRGFEQGGNEIADVVSWIIRVSVASIPVVFLILFLVFIVLRATTNRRQPDPGRGAPPRA